MTHASLFSGIGGFDLAAEWMGWTNVFNCEWEEFPRRVLKHHFPNAKQYGDIRELRATAYAGRIDILTGGFPCQPYSLAGKRKGKEDERHLWPEMLRVIRECAPRYVVGENVRGLVGWNGGLVFEEVCSDLEACGYAVQPFLLPAAGVGSCPHRRDRIWFVAYSDDKGRGDKSGQVQGAHEEVRQRHDDAEPCDPSSNFASDSDNPRTYNGLRTDRQGEAQDEGREGLAFAKHRAHGGDGDVAHPNLSGREGEGEQPKSTAQDERTCNTSRRWHKFPSVSPLCGRDDGISKELDGITFSKWRRESIKAYGNAIVPQVAFQIFKAINLYENGTRV